MIPQTYGGEEEWGRHYDYFRSFFLDERYIKEGKRPVLLIYRLRNIPRFNDMIRYWNKRAVEDGFEGIYIVSMNVCREHVEKSIWVNGTVDFEPNRTKSERLQSGSVIEPKNKGGWLWNRFAIKAIHYDAINREMLRKRHEKGHYRTVFVNYDDSPRRNLRAIVTRGSSPGKFGRYLKSTIQKTADEGNGFVFINAWNEWGEGNYLEPDVRYKYSYLRQVRKCTGHVDSRKGERCRG